MKTNNQTTPEIIDYFLLTEYINKPMWVTRNHYERLLVEAKTMGKPFVVQTPDRFTKLLILI